MKALLLIIATSISAFCASGCIYTTRPSVTGDVVDAASGSHLSGVEIALYEVGPESPDDGIQPATMPVAKRDLVAISKSEGRFELPPEIHCTFWPVVMGHPMWWRLWISRTDYEPVAFDFFSSFNDETMNIGSIALHRLSTTSR